MGLAGGLGMGQAANGAQVMPRFLAQVTGEQRRIEREDGVCSGGG